VKSNGQLLNSLRDRNDNLSLLVKAADDGEHDIFNKLLEHPQDFFMLISVVGIFSIMWLAIETMCG